MRKIKNLFLPLLAIAVTAIPAAAEFTEAAPEAAIEVTSDSPLVNQLERFLDDHNQSGLSESVLARHIRAALLSNGTMTGSYGSAGSGTPMLKGDSDVAVFNLQNPGNRLALQGAEGVGPGSLSLSAAAGSGAHNIGSGYVSSASAQVVASNGSTISVSNVVNDIIKPTGDEPIKGQPVPVPAAALLFVSGLAGFPLTRRLRRTDRG